jgi:hypothetical protein
MKTLTLDILIILFTAFIIGITGHITVFGTQKQEWQLQGEGHKNHINIDYLPESVREALEHNYEDWNPSSAFIQTSRGRILYEVELNNKRGDKTITVKISSDGMVIGEEENTKYRKYRNGTGGGRAWFV